MRVPKFLPLALLLFPVSMQGIERGDTADFSRRVAPYAVRIGSSLVINAALTEVLKSTIHEIRPDRSDNDSWPSRHVSWTSTVASIVGHELYRKSAWWVIGAHAVTDAMMIQRSLCNAHYPKDTFGGLVTGLISTEIGYFLGDLIYPGERETLPDATADFLPSFDVTTTAMFPLNGATTATSARMAINTSVRAALPLSDHWGITAAVNMRSMPVYHQNSYMTHIDGGGVSAGAVFYIPLPSRRFSIEARALPGFIANFHGGDLRKPHISFTTDINIGASCTLTPSLSLGAEIGYSLWTLNKSVSSITFGAFTRASF